MASQMFIVVAIKGADRVRPQVEKFDTDDYFELKSDTWLVLFDGTSRKLAEDLGIRSGINGTGFVAPITSYSGRAPSDLWEWLKVRWPQDG